MIQTTDTRIEMAYSPKTNARRQKVGLVPAHSKLQTFLAALIPRDRFKRGWSA